MIDIIKTSPGASKDMINKEVQVLEAIQKITDLSKGNESEDNVLACLNDPNLGNICLKLLVILLRAHHKNKALPRDFLYQELNSHDQILITTLMSYRDKQSDEENKKGRNLMTFVLDEIYKLDTD